MAKRYSEETKEKARAMRASGMTYVDIAKEIGCTKPCVRFWCDENARALNHEKALIRYQDPENKDVMLATVGARRCGQNYKDIGPEERLGIEALYRTAREMSQGDLFFEVDHIVPVSKGGEHRIWNLRIMPRHMNRTGRPRK